MTEYQWGSGDSPLDRPNVARMYDYFLGGNHNLAIDREAAEAAIAAYPEVLAMARTNRSFLRRAVTFLVEQGIDQFVDLGSGIPTVDNVHEIAQQLNPAARVLYVDIDPITVSYSQAMLQATPNVTIVQADVRRPDQILQYSEVRQLLDFSKPVAILIVALLHFVTDDAEAYHLIHTLRDIVTSGSYLAISHVTYEGPPPTVPVDGEKIYAHTTHPIKFRSRAQIEAFFAGFNLIEPGLVYVPLWRPESPDDLLLDRPQLSAFFAGVGHKP